MFIINKIHEISQEKIRENSIKWFNTEFDDIGLDIKVKRPIDQQKDSEFIKIIIPKDKTIEDQINQLNKGEYISCKIFFKGLKVSSDNITEEWELKEFITQKMYDENQHNNYICDIKIDNLLEYDMMNIENNDLVAENNNLVIENNDLVVENNDLIIKDKLNEIIEEIYEEVSEKVLLEKNNNELNTDDIIKTIYLKNESKDVNQVIKKKYKKEKDLISDISITDRIRENKMNKLSLNSHIKKKSKKIIFT